MRLHHVPLEGFSTVYSFCAALAGYEGKKWERLASKVDEDEVLSLREFGRTVMHWAAEDESRAKLVGVIAARDAGLVNAQDNAGCTPLHVAAQFGREAAMQALLAAGADTNAQDTCGGTPLHLAVQYGGEAVARALLAAGADTNAKDKLGSNSGYTPLFYARHGGQAALVALLS